MLPSPTHIRETISMWTQKSRTGLHICTAPGRMILFILDSTFTFHIRKHILHNVTSDWRKYELAQEKRDLMFFQFVGLQMSMHSPLFGLETCVFCLTSSRSLLHVWEQQRLWGDCAYVQACLCDKYPSLKCWFIRRQILRCAYCQNIILQDLPINAPMNLTFLHTMAHLTAWLILWLTPNKLGHGETVFAHTYFRKNLAMILQNKQVFSPDHTDYIRLEKKPYYT